MATRKFGIILMALSGVFLAVLGLVALSLALAPRPTNINAELFSRMRTIEWGVAILFGVLGLAIVRSSIGKYTNVPKDLTVQKSETYTVVVAGIAVIGLIATTFAVLSGTVSNQNRPKPSNFSRGGP